MEKYRRGRGEVIVIHLSNRKAEIGKFVVTAIETGQDGIMIVDPLLHILLYVEVHHA
jgi:hypothetical protein